MNFSQSDLNEMRVFYQEELDKAVKRLQHIKNVLTSIGVSVAHQIEHMYSDLSTSKDQTTSKTRRSKRGPKPKWEGIIIDVLKKLDKTLTYDELTDEILKREGLDESNRASTKTAIAAVISRLKKKKIRAFSAGIREKYIGLSRWFDDDGTIKRGYMPSVPAKEAIVKAPKKELKQKIVNPVRKVVANTIKASKPTEKVTKTTAITKTIKEPVKRSTTVKKTPTIKAKITSLKSASNKPTGAVRKTTAKNIPVTKVNAASVKKVKPIVKNTPAKATPVTKVKAEAKMTPLTKPKPAVKARSEKKVKPTVKNTPVKKATPVVKSNVVAKAAPKATTKAKPAKK